MYFINGSLNSFIAELDYQALIDAIEGPQVLSYLNGFDVKMPPDVSIFLATIRNAASVEPSSLIRDEDDPTIA